MPHSYLVGDVSTLASSFLVADIDEAGTRLPRTETGRSDEQS